MMSTSQAIHDDAGRAMRVIAVSLAAVLVVGCARGTRVDSTWSEGAGRDQVFGKVLVVGVTPSYNVRCRFERLLRDSLASAGTVALTSCSKMTSKDSLTREAVVAIVRDLGADAVLATRLVDRKAAVVEGGDRESRGANYYKPVGYGYAYDPYYGGYGVPVTYVDFVAEESSFTLQRTVVISTNLYETQGASVVYTLDTTTYDKKSPDDVVDAVTEAIAARLRRDGLVR